MPNLNTLINLKEELRWRKDIYRRFALERTVGLQHFKANQFEKVIYVLGMPRTGSSITKNFLGECPDLIINKFERNGFYKAIQLAQKTDKIVVDKSTHYIREIAFLNWLSGSRAHYLLLVRDPRDQLMSLFDFPRHKELPRSRLFWNHWYDQYSRAKVLLEHNQNVFLLRYEDFVKDPIKEKIRFFNWANQKFGLKISTAHITNDYKVAHANDIQDDKILKENSIHTNSINQWKLNRDPEKKDILDFYIQNKNIKDLMAYYGYAGN